MDERKSFEEEIESSGYIVYTTRGTSMNPLIHEKSDISVISKVPEGGPKKYDVVLYKANGNYILHRLIRIKKDGSLYILGDNLTRVEKYPNGNMIIGVLTALTRNGKNVDLNGLKYKLYVHVWCDWYQARIFVQKVILKIKAAKRKLFSKR